jgi:hypothetical protein
MAATTIIIEKRVSFNRDNRDFDCFVSIDGDEQYIGSRGTHTIATAFCDSYVYDILQTEAQTIPMPSIEALAEAAADLVLEADQASNPAAVRGYNKAALMLHQGIEITPTSSAFLIPSRTTANVVYRLDHVRGCDCSAGRAGLMCWHACLLTIIERAQIHSVPLAERIAAQRRRALDTQLVAA